MNKWMNKYVLLLVAAGLLSGCATRGTVTSPRASGAPGQPRAAAVAEMRYLNLSVGANGSNRDGVVVAGLLQQKMANNLASQGLVISDASSSDVRLNLNVQAEPFDQSGNYYVYDAELTASAILSAGQRARPLGINTFKVRSERKLGKADALRSASDVLSKQSTPWCLDAVSPASCGLLANDVTVRIPWFKTRTGQAKYARDFIQTVSGMGGVVTCRVMEHDYNAKTVVFRVVYFRDSFPAGLLNKLATKDRLNIKAM